MKRRRALTIAGTVVATAVAAVLALAANIGLLGFGRADHTSLGSLTAKQPIEIAAEEAATPAPAAAPAPPPARERGGEVERGPDDDADD